VVQVGGRRSEVGGKSEGGSGRSSFKVCSRLTEVRLLEAKMYRRQEAGDKRQKAEGAVRN
jgi:hypothetical protein